jgi:hypothetical protein
MTFALPEQVGWESTSDSIAHAAPPSVWRWCTCLLGGLHGQVCDDSVDVASRERRVGVADGVFIGGLLAGGGCLCGRLVSWMSGCDRLVV